MKSPDFWWRATPNALSHMLFLPEKIFRFLATARMNRTRKESNPIPILCVGDLVAGGSGKTPTALALAAEFQRRGKRVIFLTRGYGRKTTGTYVVDLKKHTARDVGDEPLLLARLAPTLVSDNRKEGLRIAQRFAPDCVILDDGLQDPHVSKDFSIAVIDGTYGLGNGRCLPAGPLRAPLETQRDHMDCVLITAPQRPFPHSLFGDKPVFETRREARRSIEAFPSREVVAFCGIGHPENFFATLTQNGFTIVARRAFPDHHFFTDKHAKALLAQAHAAQARLITTEKDFMRLEGSLALDLLRARTDFFPIRDVLPEALSQLCFEALFKTSPL